MAEVQSWSSFYNMYKDADVMLCTVVHCIFFVCRQVEHAWTTRHPDNCQSKVSGSVAFHKYHMPVEFHMTLFSMSQSPAYSAV